MRLWHKFLIPYLPRQQLLGQWRECVAVAGMLKTGTLKHSLVSKVQNYPIQHFVRYCFIVHDEMIKRGYKISCDVVNKIRSLCVETFEAQDVTSQDLFVGWHNTRYLTQCFFNLQEKHDCDLITDDEWKLLMECFRHLLGEYVDE